MDKTISHANKAHSLKGLSGTLKKQTEIEKKIIKARLSSISIFEMDEKNIKVFCDALIFKCSAFTGCELPVTDYYADVLSASIIRFLLDMGYGDLTLEEIELALSVNCSHQHKLPLGIELPEITFFGKGLNIFFLSKILGNYMILRNHLDRRFQNLIDGHE